MRKINKAGLAIIKKWEGIEDGNPKTVNLDPYLCPAKVWTIGWGHAITYNGRHLTTWNDPSGDIARNIYPGGITKEEAEGLLIADTSSVAIQIEKAVKINLTDNQFSALVSFTYNVGIGNLLKSTLLRKINARQLHEAVREFPKWRKANGKILHGLEMRRCDEKRLFIKL